MIKYSVILTVIHIYTIIDCAMTDQEKVRRFPKWAWLLIIVFTGTIGDIAWFVAGRPRKPGQNRGGRGRIIPPDDDPDFLRKL
ncbi:MAG: PLDc_N domain-containing protein [Actinobacteria bacterium]|nr:PLDc_N domain-containing protein [Actinomycetota bacterium]